jgi:alpha-methylacyl-CoA racemase
LAQAAGHDINYIAITGVLSAIGQRDQKPLPPLNLVGDFGGGSMFLLFGLLCALQERHRSGLGQVVDAAMIDGASAMLAPILGLREQGYWSGGRGANLLDGGAHFYTTYRTSDDAYISIGPIEPHFYALLLEKLGLSGDAALALQMQEDQWPAMTRQLEAVFALRTRAQWIELLEGTDVCFAPVLDFDEAPHHPHNAARQAYVTVGGVRQPAPAPRFSRTPTQTPHVPSAQGADMLAVCKEWGLPPDHPPPG